VLILKEYPDPIDKRVTNNNKQGKDAATIIFSSVLCVFF
jgi:hypothetical protein